MVFQELRKQLEDHFDGQPWYGPNLQDSLEDIDLSIIDLQVGKHSIKDLVAHIINWRQFAIEKLSQNEVFDIQVNSAQDWMPEELLRDISWENLLELLEITQNNLLKAIENMDRDLLEQQVKGRWYNYQHLLFGIIQHDIYHLGQINIIKRYWNEQTE